MVQVAIQGAEAMFAWIDFATNAINAGHQHGGKCQVGVRRVVRRAELDALCRWAIGQRDAHGCTTVAFREDQVNGRFKAWYQAFVAVGSSGNNSQERRGMCQQTTNVVTGELGDACIAFAIIEQRFLTFP